MHPREARGREHVVEFADPPPRVRVAGFRSHSDIQTSDRPAPRQAPMSRLSRE